MAIIYNNAMKCAVYMHNHNTAMVYSYYIATVYTNSNVSAKQFSIT